jgi:NTP pyrophosphatase (non-canonical NTP hydrolase)
MLLDDYQSKAKEFVGPGVPNEERVMGLLAESGEVAGVFQKLIRGTYTPLEAEKLLFKELGDCLWYLSQIAEDNGWRLHDIAMANIEKLESRKLRNVLLTGTGDER